MAYDANLDATFNPSVGGTPTAAYLDAVNANFAALGAAWTAYTPAWAGSGGLPSIGNGTLVGAYRLVGKTLDFRIYCLAGGTTTFGAGVYSWSLPSGLTSINREQVVAATAVNFGTTRYRAVGIIAASDSVVKMQADDGANLVGSGTPVTWNATDFFTIGGTIEVA